MKRIEENGRIYYQWEPHEEEARKNFEKALIAVTEDFLVDLTLKLIKESAHDRSQAWNQIRALTGVKEGDFAYEQVSGRFRLIPKNADDEFDEHEVAFNNLKAYCRTISRERSRVVNQEGEIVGYWQTPEWIDGLLNLCDGADRP